MTQPGPADAATLPARRTFCHHTYCSSNSHSYQSCSNTQTAAPLEISQLPWVPATTQTVGRVPTVPGHRHCHHLLLLPAFSDVHQHVPRTLQLYDSKAVDSFTEVHQLHTTPSSFSCTPYTRTSLNDHCFSMRTTPSTPQTACRLQHQVQHGCTIRHQVRSLSKSCFLGSSMSPNVNDQFVG